MPKLKDGFRIKRNCNTFKTLGTTMQYTINAIEQGRIDPEVGRAMIAGLKEQRGILESRDLYEELNKREKALEEKKSTEPLKVLEGGK